MCVHWLNLIDIKLCYISVQRHRVFAWLLLLFCCCVVKSSHMVNSGSNTYKSYILWIGSNIVLGWFINKIIIHSNSPTIDWYSWRKKKIAWFQADKLRTTSTTHANDLLDDTSNDNIFSTIYSLHDLGYFPSACRVCIFCTQNTLKSFETRQFSFVK